MKLRDIYLFALLAIPAISAPHIRVFRGRMIDDLFAACTLSANYNLSASGGHWTGTGCTGATYIPGNGDTVALADGVTLTQDQNWTIGASGASNTTPAISVTDTGNVVVNAGNTLTLRGDFLSGGQNYGTAAFLTMAAGSSLVFDSSLSVSPTTTRYRVGTSGPWQYRQLLFNGTSAAHVTVTSNLANGALAGQVRTGSVGTTGGYGIAYLSGTYVDFSNIGDGTTYGDAIYADVCTGCVDLTFSLQHFTFTNSGQLVFNNFEPTVSALLSYGAWTHSLGTASFAPVSLSGPATFQHLSLDLPITEWGGTGAVVFNDDYFGVFLESVKLPGSGNFFREPITTDGPVGDGMTNPYILLDTTANDNPHWLTIFSAVGVINGGIFDQPDDVTADSGEMVGVSNTGTLQNSILLPTKTGHGNSEFNSNTGLAPPVGTLIYLYHNTWVGDTALSGNGAFAMVQSNEGGATLAPVTAMESNLGWSNGGAYCKVGSEATSLAGALLNPVTLADYNYADVNAIRTLGVACSGIPCTSTNCPNSANSYFGNWSSATAQGPHDVDVLQPTVTHPYLADTTRNVATFDTAYLHTAAGAQWVTSTAYTVGQIVSDPKAGVYNGATVNYRCTVAHTSGSSTEPNVGASWRTDWEFASLADIRTATPAGTTYIDGAIGCSAGCTAIQALEGWVKRGFTPQNPALWCSGHDGEAVGAVPFCANGRLTLGMLGSIAGM